MKLNLNNFQNMDFNNMINILMFISFIIQWSFISMMINLFTMGLFRFPLFILMLVDIVSILFIDNKSVKKPSFVLGKIWDVIDYFVKPSGYHDNSYGYGSNDSIFSTLQNINSSLEKVSHKIKNMFNNIKSWRINNKKYDKERELNKFDPSVAKKICIEYTSPNNKLKKKSFEYRDRATTYIRMLEKNGYKNYTRYNLNINESSAYIIFNENKDIVDLENNKIQIKSKDKDYKHVVDQWPKK